MMGFHNGLDIAEPQTEAFDIMEITRVGPVKFLKDAPLGLLTHADAVVFNAYHQAFGSAVRSNADEKVLLRIFHRIIDEIGYQVGKMYFIGHDQVILGVELQFRPSPLSVQLQLEILHGFLDDSLGMDGTQVKLLLLPVEQRCLKNGLHLLVHTAIFFFYNAGEILRFLSVLDHLLVLQRIYGQGDGGQRRFELMGHVIDEIILDLTQFLLPEEGRHRHIKGSDDHNGKEDSAPDHPPHLAQCNVPEIRNNDDHQFVGQEAAYTQSFRSLQRIISGVIVDGIFKFPGEILRTDLGWTK